MIDKARLKRKRQASLRRVKARKVALQRRTETVVRNILLVLTVLAASGCLDPQPQLTKRERTLNRKRHAMNWEEQYAVCCDVTHFITQLIMNYRHVCQGASAQSERVPTHVSD